MTVDIRAGIAKMDRMGFKITNQNGRVDNGSHIYGWKPNMVRYTIVKAVNNETEGT